MLEEISSEVLIDLGPEQRFVTLAKQIRITRGFKRIEKEREKKKRKGREGEKEKKKNHGNPGSTTQVPV